MINVIECGQMTYSEVLEDNSEEEVGIGVSQSAEVDVLLDWRTLGCQLS